MKRALLLILLILAGCSLPQWRIFQKKVDGKAAETPKAQVEGQKTAASYIAKRTASPVADPAAAVADVHDVAASLSASLGEPDKPVALADREKVIGSLRAGLRAKEDQLDAWKAFGRKYAGTPLEGTGVNIAGPAGLLVMAGIVAACIACPALGYCLLRVIPLLWGFFTRTTAAVADLAKSHPEAADALKANLAARMDEAHKKLVARRLGKVMDSPGVPRPTGIPVV